MAFSAAAAPSAFVPARTQASRATAVARRRVRMDYEPGCCPKPRRRPSPSSPPRRSTPNAMPTVRSVLEPSSDSETTADLFTSGWLEPRSSPAPPPPLPPDAPEPPPEPSLPDDEPPLALPPEALSLPSFAGFIPAPNSGAFDAAPPRPRFGLASPCPAAFLRAWSSGSWYSTPAGLLGSGTTWPCATAGDRTQLAASAAMVTRYLIRVIKRYRDTKLRFPTWAPAETGAQGGRGPAQEGGRAFATTESLCRDPARRSECRVPGRPPGGHPPILRPDGRCRCRRSSGRARSCRRAGPSHRRRRCGRCRPRPRSCRGRSPPTGDPSPSCRSVDHYPSPHP